MSLLQGFKGWASGVLKGLDTWERKLAAVSVPETLERDLAALRSTLDAIQGMRTESTLVGLMQAGGVIVPFGARSFRDGEPSEPFLAEDNTTIGDTELNIDPLALSVLVVISQKGGAAEDSLFPAHQRIASQLQHRGFLAKSEAGVFTLSPKGSKILKTFAKVFLREGVGDGVAAPVLTALIPLGESVTVDAAKKLCRTFEAMIATRSWGAITPAVVEEKGTLALRFAATAEMSPSKLHDRVIHLMDGLPPQVYQGIFGARAPVPALRQELLDLDGDMILSEALTP